jgi:hypothetical protein
MFRTGLNRWAKAGIRHCPPVGLDPDLHRGLADTRFQLRVSEGILNEFRDF